MCFSSRSFVIRAAVLMVCGLMPAIAQAQSARTPVRGWFGSGRAGAGQGQSLSLIGRAFEVLDTGRDAVNPELQAGIRYDRQSRQRSFFFAADASSRRYAEFDGPAPVSYDATAGVAANIGRRTRLQVIQGFRTSPFYLVTLAPRPDAAGSIDAASAPESAGQHALFERHTRALTGTVAMTHLLARHTSVTLDYGFERARTEATGFNSHYAKATLSQYLGRYAIARAGYGRRIVSRNGLQFNEKSVHDFDIGLDYNRPFSVSRRTKLMFATGSALVPHDGGHRYRLLGTASLSREIGRSWKAALDYGRNLEFVETFAEPLLSDSVGARLEGRITRRLNFTASANVSNGSVGFAGAGHADNSYDTYGATARLRWSISRLITSQVEYVAYGQGFGSSVELPERFGSEAKRSEIRVGLTLWAPLVR